MTSTETSAAQLATFLMWQFDLAADEAAGFCVTMTPLARRETLRAAGLPINRHNLEGLWDDARAHLLAADVR